MIRRSHRLMSCCLVLVALVGLPAVCHADSIMFNLTSDHCSGTCGPKPFGVITVTDLTGGNLKIDISLNNGNTFVNTGFDVSVGFNLSSTITSIAYTSLPDSWSIPDLSAGRQAAGNYHVDGTGYFKYGILWGTQGGAGKGDSGPISFTISASGLTLSSLTTNDFGQYFAVDIYNPTTGNTGPVDASSPVPEPSTLILLGIGISGLGLGALRRKK